MDIKTDWRELVRVIQDEQCQRRARNEARKAEEDKLMRKLIQNEEGWKRVKKLKKIINQLGKNNKGGKKE